jgi:cob(I)alamin adenosyltransferase
LNSFLGLLRAKVVQDKGDWCAAIDAQLGWIQNRLFDVGAVLSGADMPFAEDRPPITITIPMARIPWAIHEKSLAIAAPQPSSLTPEGPVEQKTLIPFGSTMLRMTEMPIVKAD